MHTYFSIPFDFTMYKTVFKLVNKGQVVLMNLGWNNATAYLYGDRVKRERNVYRTEKFLNLLKMMCLLLNCNSTIHTVMHWTLIIIRSCSCRCPTNNTISSSISRSIWIKTAYISCLIICSSPLSCLDVKRMISSIYTKIKIISCVYCYWRGKAAVYIISCSRS